MKSNGATTNMESEKSDQAVAALEQMSVSGGAVGKFKKKEVHEVVCVKFDLSFTDNLYLKCLEHFHLPHKAFLHGFCNQLCVYLGCLL